MSETGRNVEGMGSETRKPTVGSLFSGIGGIDLGFERAGFEVLWQVEIEGYCQNVLRKHWPNARLCEDVKQFPPTKPEEWAVDVICGGFPCQDISIAGRGKGIAEGTRSGLWSEFARIIRQVRPQYVVVENVAALLNNGIGRVLGDLATSGYDAEWDCIPASALGAPHCRDRVFIIAYRHGYQLCGSIFARESPTYHKWWTATQTQQTWEGGFAQLESVGVGLRHYSYAHARGVLDGVPSRVDRLGGLGNAVVPQVAEFIGRLLMERIQRERT